MCPQWHRKATSPTVRPNNQFCLLPDEASITARQHFSSGKETYFQTEKGSLRMQVDNLTRELATTADQQTQMTAKVHELEKENLVLKNRADEVCVALSDSRDGETVKCTANVPFLCRVGTMTRFACSQTSKFAVGDAQEQSGHDEREDGDAEGARPAREGAGPAQEQHRRSPFKNASGNSDVVKSF